MEARVTRLEDDMSDVRAILGRLEPMITRIDATMPFLATKAEMQALRVEMAEQFGQVRVEFGQVRAETADQFAQVRAETAEQFAQVRAEFAQVRAETAAQFAQVRSETASQFSQFRVDLARRPTIAGMWACGASLMAIALGGMAAGAVYLPFVFRVMHMPPP